MTSRLALLVIATLAALGCSDESGALSGSVSTVYRLDYESVRARLYSSELAIEYVDGDSAVPVRVTLRVDDVELARRSYDLAQHGDIGGRRADGTELPRFRGGSLSLERFAPEPGARVTGSFEAKFDSGRDTLTLTGDFDTSLEVVGWPPQPG